MRPSAPAVRARGLEIDPHYVDVTVRRWQNYTGKAAVLAATGATFEEITEERNSAAALAAPGGAMTNSQDDATVGDRQAKNRPKEDYDVGYCKPPAAHRFKHGNKANPKGRKKGARNRKVVIREVLFEAVTVREGGEIRQMSALEAVLKKMLSKALAGDNKAALTIIGIAQKEGILRPSKSKSSKTCPKATWRSWRT